MQVTTTPIYEVERNGVRLLDHDDDTPGFELREITLDTRQMSPRPTRFRTQDVIDALAEFADIVSIEESEDSHIEDSGVVITLRTRPSDEHTPEYEACLVVTLAYYSLGMMPEERTPAEEVHARMLRDLGIEQPVEEREIDPNSAEIRLLRALFGYEG